MASNAVGSIATCHLRFNAKVACPTEFSAGSSGFFPQKKGGLDGFAVWSDAMGNLKKGVETH